MSQHQSLRVGSIMNENGKWKKEVEDIYGS